MASTPPPPVRIHTPPTPLHGPKFDSWEPYSPKRQTRTNAKRTQPVAPPVTATPVKGHRRQRSSTSLIATPAQRKKGSAPHVPSYALSPPSSPETSGRTKTKSPTSHSAHEDIVPQPPAEVIDATSFLPTPRKTPKKRDTGSNTARVLHFRTPSDSILSTPRKRRQRITLDSPQESEPSVPIFTDSQDRVPEMEHSDDNPFVGPRRKVRSSSVGHTPRRRQTAEEDAMDEAVKNDEGLIYIFRGRKMFRPYADTTTSTEATTSTTSQTSRIRRMAGIAAQRPITRSKLQPRLLFTDADADQQSPVHEDEEADTDIEDATPIGSQQSATGSCPPETESGPSTTPRPAKRARASPFDAWPRQKAGRAASHGTKRGGEAQSNSPAKRSRSSVATA